MPEYRVSFNRIEDGVATFALYEDGDFQENIHYSVENLPNGVEPTQLDDQFRPEFEDEEIVALHYDPDLTRRKNDEFGDGDGRYGELLGDS